MAGASPLERILARDRIVTGVALALLCLLAWLYLLTGAGQGMNVAGMSRLVLFPHEHSDAMGGAMGAGMVDMPGMPAPSLPAAWSVGKWLLMVLMWWTMMIAMMVPAAAPTILLYAQVHRHAEATGQARARLAPTGAFAAGYLLVWLAFALVATALQMALEAGGVLSGEMMASQKRWLSAAVLLAAGLYQLSPIKDACLSHCRSPASFLSRHWRPGVTGALRLGALHGAYCVGCCWVLMALLFVGGVMNLAWIAALTLLVIVEKLLPVGAWLGRAAGLLLIMWGIATLLR
jgi:predicted metal-binding membrane protein